MKEILLVIMVVHGSVSIQTERVATMEECRTIISKLREQSEYRIDAACIEVEKIEHDHQDN